MNQDAAADSTSNAVRGVRGLRVKERTTVHTEYHPHVDQTE